MMCTITSLQSTSTHSPASAPSTLTMSPPASFTFSTTEDASARVWRFDVPLAITTRSNMSDNPAVLKTSMFVRLDVFERIDDQALQFSDIQINPDTGDANQYSRARRQGPSRTGAAPFRLMAVRGANAEPRWPTHRPASSRTRRCCRRRALRATRVPSARVPTTACKSGL